jgi:hypothetical protein
LHCNSQRSDVICCSSKQQASTNGAYSMSTQHGSIPLVGWPSKGARHRHH